MANEITIPLLPCQTINAMLPFYVALGFEITYQQTKPNSYAVVKREDIELHFFAMRDFEPANSYSSCFIWTPDVDGLYKAFAAGLRQKYGKLPITGLPRITPLKNKSGYRGFNVIDPGGNWLRIGQKAETTQFEADLSKLGRALEAAELLADSKGDFAMAAKTLDKALAHADEAAAAERVRALALGARIAVALGDSILAAEKLRQIQQISLTDEEKSNLTAELEQIEELRAQISPTS
jgi:hypothetical protein